MSTEYKIHQFPGSDALYLDEHSSVVDLRRYQEIGKGGTFSNTVAEGLTADEVARMAVEMLKVASYLDPEAIPRTAQHLGEKDDWDYYAETIRGLL
jgi:hypothetical protein